MPVMNSRLSLSKMLLKSWDVHDTVLSRERPPLDRDAVSGLRLRRSSHEKWECSESSELQMHGCKLDGER